MCCGFNKQTRVGGGDAEASGSADGTFPKSFWIRLTHPSGKERVESVWEGEATLER